ncbi:MAG TPA: PEP-CTERM sorting domain-containing protein, partial [Bryobacteraceae bacterium]|nr:PEP-CTERM sorting domain-containing protein [Bryobacteraceae bacterium]
AGSYLQYSNVMIYTPSPLSASQEFLVVAGVPEPSAIYAFGAGLISLMGIAFRRKRTLAPVSNQ